MDERHNLSKTINAGAPSAVSVALGRPSLGERLWLWRLTERGDGRRVSLLEAAERFGLDVSAYWAVETGYDRLSDTVVARARQAAERGLSLVTEPVMTVPLACRLARRRSERRLGELVLELGVGSRPTFYKLEAEGNERLVKFWRERGFSFDEVPAA